MGEQNVESTAAGEPSRRFLKSLLEDIRALERMLEEGRFETGVRRIGAEQEMFLAGEAGRPANAAVEVLRAVDDPHFTHELALFNLELNLDPLPLQSGCLTEMERVLHAHLARVREAAHSCGVDVVLTGILPSLRKSDMGLENMTPLPRYRALDQATTALRGGPLEFRIKGVDELAVTHDSVMLEACNASFQVHYQVDPGRFIHVYNAAQAYAAPVLAAAVNAPLLFGRRLWQETRIALFQQAVETRGSNREIREAPSRVHFGRQWLEHSVVDLFREDVSRHRVLLSGDIDGDPLQALDAGRLPELKALRLHNSTIWRWNRPCYGITAGKAHLRIENRVLPSGPTVVDEVANAAFWLGLMRAAEEEPDFAGRLDFEAAKENFVAAARQGLSAQFSWTGERTIPAQQLIEQELLPRARQGLQEANLDRGEVDHYLDIIARRVGTGRTGSRWLLQSMAGMSNKGTASERLSALTRAIINRQEGKDPVHLWPLAELKEAGGWKRHYLQVMQYMTTDLFTVREEDSVDLVASMMDWHRIRHVPVEDARHHLVGLVSHRTLLRVLAEGRKEKDGSPLPVTAIMKRELLTVAPETETLEAIEIMRQNRVACLPVVKDGRLVGIVTERDFMVITRELLYQKLRE